MNDTSDSDTKGHTDKGDADKGRTDAGDGTPKFGRLFVVLVLAVMLIGVITLSAEDYYS